MKKAKGLIVLLAVLVIMGGAFFALRPARISSENLIKNGSFSERDASGSPRDWYEDAYLTIPGYSDFSSDAEGAHIVNHISNDARFAQYVPVAPDTLYCLHGLIRADAEGGMGANLSIEGVYVFSNCVYDTENAWEEVTLYGRTGKNQNGLTVFARLGGYSGEAAGEAWFRDITLTQVSQVPSGFSAVNFYQPDHSADDSPGSSESTGTMALLLCCFGYVLLLWLLYHQLHGKTMSGTSWSAWTVILFLAAVCIRIIVALRIPGYDVDIGCFTAWANRMAQTGPGTFYTGGGFCDYPPGYMLILWIIGTIGRTLGTGATEFLVKLPSVFADCAAALVLMVFAMRFLGEQASGKKPVLPMFIAGAYLFCPAIILSGAGWGQSDGVMTLFLLLTVVFALENKWRYALPAYMLAVLMKPQALMFGPLGLVALAVHLVSGRKNASNGKLSPFADAGIGLCALVCVAFAVVVPFNGGRGLSWIFELYHSTMGYYGYATVNACNLYFLLGYNWCDSAQALPALVPIFAGLLVIVPAAILLTREYSHHGADLLHQPPVHIMIAIAGTFLLMALLCTVLPLNFSQFSVVMIVLTLLLCGGLLCFGRDLTHLPLLGMLALSLIFCTGGMMHERYLFPVAALGFLAFALEKDGRILLPTGGMILSMTLNVGAALSRNARIGGAAGHLSAPLVNIVSDMAIAEYAAAVLMIISCAWLVFICLDRILTDHVPISKPLIASSHAEHTPDLEKDGQYLKEHRMLRADWVIMLGVTAVYACVAFFHLGSVTAPQTSYQFQQAGETVTFDLGDDFDDFRMLYYGGIHYYDSDFIIQTSHDGVTWGSETECEMKIGSLFQWKYVKPMDHEDARQMSGRYVRLTVQQTGLTLFETLFRDENGNVLPNVTAKSSSGKNVSALLDEQDTLDGEPSWYNSMYFDEIYHARTAYEHLHRITPYETSHPPLGKVIMSWCVALFGMTPFGWRFAGTLCGVLMLPGMYLLGRLLFKKRRFAVLSIALMALDCMHFTQTRLATIDSFVVLFIIWSVYFMFRWFFSDFFGQKLWKTLLPLGLSGLMMGLAVASKWTGCYAGVGLACVFFYGVYRRWRIISQMKKSDDSCSRAQNARTQGQKNLLITVASCLIFFVAVPCVIYYCAYIPYFAPNGGVSVRRVVEAAKGMFAYHSTPGLGMDHPFYSPWYEWPLSIKPMYYAADQYEPAGFACTILAFGNPAVWWVGIVCLMTVLVMFGIRGWKALSGRGQMDCRLPLLLISFAAQFLPWMLVPRGTYIYHYFPSVPFIILCTALCLEKLETVCTEWEMSRGGSGSTANHASLALIGLYILIVLALFIALFPYASGMLTPVSWLNSVNWFHNLYY